MTEEMTRQTKRISRRELYDLVWSTPITTLAKNFGLSDRGLAKICSRHRISTPPRGFWAKVAAGEKISTPPFLELRDRTPDQIQIRSTMSSFPVAVSEMVEKRRAEKKSLAKKRAKMTVFKFQPVRNPHPAIAPTVKALRKSKPDDSSRVFANEDGQCGVVVHVDRVERAVFVLDSLTRALDDIGLSLQPDGQKMSVSLGPDSISFTLVERTRRQKHIPTEQELEEERRQKAKHDRAWRRNGWDNFDFGFSKPWSEYDTICTGELVFSIDVRADGLRKTWGDGKTQRVERMVPDIVAGIEIILSAVKARREEREERERIRTELERRRQLAKARKQREEERIKYLRSLVDLQREASDIRSWLATLPADARPTPETELGRMLKWANERVAGLDRLTTVDAANAALDGKPLFPEVDDLHDPFGSPPPSYGWG